MDARKLTLPIAVVASLLGAAAGGGVAAGMSKAELKEHDQAITELKERVKVQEDRSGAQTTDIAVIKIKIESVEKGIDRLEQHFGTKP